MSRYIRHIRYIVYGFEFGHCALAGYDFCQLSSVRICRQVPIGSAKLLSWADLADRADGSPVPSEAAGQHRPMAATSSSVRAPDAAAIAAAGDLPFLSVACGATGGFDSRSGGTAFTWGRFLCDGRHGLMMN